MSDEIAYDPHAWSRTPQVFGGPPNWADPCHVNMITWLLEAKPQRVLDVGCLDGQYIRELRRRGYRGAYRGVDITPEFVTRARELSPAEDFVVGDARALLPDHTGDVVLFANVIMHLDLPWDALACICRAAERVVLLSTYAAEKQIEEPQAGFINHWFSPAQIEAHIPSGWEVRRRVCFHPRWTADPWRHIFQAELRRVGAP